jgi:hypothetical protein
MRLEREVVRLQALVGKYDAIDIMHRAAYKIIPLFMNYTSENEFSGEEARALPCVEYLRSRAESSNFEVLRRR